MDEQELKRLPVGHMRIVVVEDDFDFAQLLHRQLRDYPLHIVAAFPTARAALTDLSLWRYADIALVDLLLPDLDGEDVLRFLKEGFPHLTRVVSTGIPDLSARPEARELADYVLHKPYLPDSLMSIFEQVRQEALDGDGVIDRYSREG